MVAHNTQFGIAAARTRGGRHSRRHALLVGTGAALAINGRVAAQKEGPPDVETLGFLLALEHLEAVLLEEALARFAAADWESAAGPGIRLDLETVRDQEQAHVVALAGAIADAGGVPIEPTPFAFGYGDIAGFFRVAAAIGRTVVAAYAGAIPLLADRAPLATVVGIHSVEGRHAAFFNLRTDQSPFPDPIDRPLGRDAALASLAGYTGPDRPPDTTAPTPVATSTPAPVPTAAPTAPVANPRTFFAAIIADAARRLGVSEEAVEIVEVTAETWPDSSLGCPEPDGLYLQVITPGYRVILQAAGTTLEYHTDELDAFVLCG